MKWLNKMKKWFQAEEIIEIEEIIIDEPLDEETLRNMDFSKLPKAKKEEIKVYNQTVEKMSEKISQTVDPDTKILFQYPKGQFKFPLIPDQEQNKRNFRERIKDKREPKQAERTKEPRKQARDPEPKRRSFDREPKPKMRNLDREQHTKIVPSNTPFRPTEIPSPIYGFRRPEKKMVASEEIVEYELETKLPVLEKKNLLKKFQCSRLILPRRLPLRKGRKNLPYLSQNRPMKKWKHRRYRLSFGSMLSRHSLQKRRVSLCWKKSRL